jgi:hypothetical protein
MMRRMAILTTSADRVQRATRRSCFSPANNFERVLELWVRPKDVRNCPASRPSLRANRYGPVHLGLVWRGLRVDELTDGITDVKQSATTTSSRCYWCRSRNELKSGRAELDMESVSSVCTLRPETHVASLLQWSGSPLSGVLGHSTRRPPRYRTSMTPCCLLPL